MMIKMKAHIFLIIYSVSRYHSIFSLVVKMSKFFSLECTIVVAIFVYFVNAIYYNNHLNYEYQVHELKNEARFKKMYPDLSNLTWQQANTLTSISLQRICDEVLAQLRRHEYENVVGDYHYVPVDEEKLQSERVIRNAPLFSFYEHQIENLTMVACVYKEITFHLAQGNNSHVFRTERDKDGIFAFKSGLHPVHF